MTERTSHEIIVSGFGGQGVVLNGNILGKAAAIHDKKNATMVQSYGPEARGGACSAHVIVSEKDISYPYVHRSHILIAMSQEGYEKNVDSLNDGGIIITDADLVRKRDSEKTDLSYSIPATRIAEELGNKMMTNIVMLGYLASRTDIVNTESLRKAVKESVPKGTEEMNLKAFDAGLIYKEAERHP